jgi:hypothetical protein
VTGHPLRFDAAETRCKELKTKKEILIKYENLFQNSVNIDVVTQIYCVVYEC